MKVCRIRNLAAALALALVLCAAPARADDLAFSHVTVVDVVEGKLLRDQMVRVAGGRIVEVGPAAGARIPKATRVVDATGKFLIPGLWDMHTHFFSGVPGCPEITFSLAVAHGVTGARDVAAHRSFAGVARGGRVRSLHRAPVLRHRCPLVDGVPIVYPPISVVARTPDEARRIVDALSRRGADFVKAYEMLGRDAPSYRRAHPAR